jgi:hypothetical protein
MDVQFLREADWALAKTGQPVPPAHGVSIVYRLKDFLVQTVVPPALQPGSTQTFTKLITGDTTWELRGIQANWFGGQMVFLQIQLPDGSYLSNFLEDDLVFAGFGSNRWTATKPIECPTNSKVIIGFDTNIPIATTAQNITMLLEGAYKYYVKSAVTHPQPVPLAEGMPRYLGNPNQNIMAPSWVQGYGPPTPQGWEDVWHTYDSGFQITSSGLFLPATTIPLVGSTVATATIQLERDSDFVVRRFFFWLAADATVTAGSILGRIRISSGYAVTNDYFDLFRYISGGMLAHELNLKAGESIVFDLNLVDFSGTGNMYFTAFAEGCKRYPRTQSALQVPLEPAINQEVIVPAGGGPVRTPPPSLRGYDRYRGPRG